MDRTFRVFRIGQFQTTRSFVVSQLRACGPVEFALGSPLTSQLQRGALRTSHAWRARSFDRSSPYMHALHDKCCVQLLVLGVRCNESAWTSYLLSATPFLVARGRHGDFLHGIVVAAVTCGRFILHVRYVPPPRWI
eukprot:638232-Pleurochrysis_carterae.AAC.1